MHGCIAVKNDELGYISVLLIGMAQISSVQLHIKTGDRVKKSNEIAHLEFGGSDIVIVFQASALVYISGAPNQQYLVCEVLPHASLK